LSRAAEARSGVSSATLAAFEAFLAAPRK